jgi:aromatic amino acid aminotransferase I
MQYKHRRDFFIDCLAEEFHLETEPAIHGIYEGCDVYHVSQRSTVEKPGYLAEKPDPAVLFSFVPPASGMFIWVSGLTNNTLFLLTSSLVEDKF